MNEKLNINQWAEEDRPREKMMALGAEALSNAELLAILIGAGSTKETAVELMKRFRLGREETIRQMVENDHILKRNTALAERLRQAAALYSL